MKKINNNNKIIKIVLEWLNKHQCLEIQLMVKDQIKVQQIVQ
jgi:hypothetical protein